MNRIDYQAQYLGNIRDPIQDKYQEGISKREDKPSANRSDRVISRQEDRQATRALHRLQSRHGFQTSDPRIQLVSMTVGEQLTTYFAVAQGDKSVTINGTLIPQITTAIAGYMVHSI